jgi:hypothetical protein
VILVLGGSSDQMGDLTVQVTRRSNGLTQGILNVYYHTYHGRDGSRNVKRFKSRVEVATYLGLFPQVEEEIYTIDRVFCYRLFFYPVPPH